MRLKQGTILRAEALLFDMDGTLVDSTPAVHRVWRRWGARHGIDGETLVRASHGRKAIETVRLYAPEGLDVAAEVAALTAEEIADIDGIVPIPGVTSLLDGLPPDRWAVVTSAERPLALVRLRAAGLPLPKVLITAEDATVGKPDPQGYLRAAAALNRPAASCLVFEDAPAGLVAGRAAGAQVIAVANPLQQSELAGETWIPDFTALRLASVADDELALEVVF